MGQMIADRPQNAALGVVMIVTSVFLMSFGDGLVKSISSDLTLWQIFVTRSLLAIPIILLLLCRWGQTAAIKTRALGWILLRSLLLVAAWILFYAALARVSFAVAATALYTAPLFIALLSAFAVGEPVRLWRATGLGFGFLGALLVLRPSADAFSYVTLLPIAGAASYAFAMILTRSMCADERPLVLSLALNVCFLLVGAVMSVGVAVWDSDPKSAAADPFLLGPWMTMDLRTWGLMALMAALIVAVTASAAKAYQSGPPALIATFDYAYLVFAAFWGFALFADLPDAATVAGMILIAAAGVLALRSPGCGQRQAEPTAPSDRTR